MFPDKYLRRLVHARDIERLANPGKRSRVQTRPGRPVQQGVAIASVDG